MSCQNQRQAQRRNTVIMSHGINSTGKSTRDSDANTNVSSKS